MSPGTIDGTSMWAVSSACLAILFDAAIKGAIVLALAGVAALWMRRASAAARHLVWLLTMASLPALPILLVALPQWKVLPDWMSVPWATIQHAESTDYREPYWRHQPLMVQVVEPLPSVSRAGPAALQPAPRLAELPGMPGSAIDPPPADPPAASLLKHAELGPGVDPAPQPFERVLEPAGGSSSWRWQAWAILVWLTGTVAALAPVILGTLSLRWVERTANRIQSGPAVSLIGRLAAQMGVRCRVNLLLSDRRAMPMQWGILRPKLLLPASARRWPADRVRMVLLHELAHVRRRDCLAQLVTQVVCAMYWFNPLVWMAVRRMQLESEAACDDLTLNAGYKPTDYAEHVLQIASGLQSNVLVACGGIAMARRTKLEGRLLAILDPKRNRRGLTRLGAAAALAGLITVVVPLAMLRAAPRAVDKQSVVGQLEPSRKSEDSSHGSGQLSHQERSHGGGGVSHPRIPPTAPDDPVELSHVDDSAEGKRSIGGSGHAIQFKRPGRAKYVAAIKIYASRYGYPQPPDEDFHVYLLDQNKQVIKDIPFPYAMIERGPERWYTLNVPPAEVPRQFYVALSFNPHQTKGIYVGIDKDVEESHSYVGLPALGFEAVSERYDWMVRAVLVSEADARKQQAPALEPRPRKATAEGPQQVKIPEGALRLSHVDDSAEGKRSFADSGHAVKFERPKDAKYVTAVQIFGSRYGYPQPPDEDFHVYLLDQDQVVIKDLPYPYGMIERGSGRWYTFEVPPTEVPEHFYVALCFNAHSTKGVYVGMDKNVDQSHSYTGLPGFGFSAVTEPYDWMIRVFLVPDADAAKMGGLGMMGGFGILPPIVPRLTGPPDEDEIVLVQRRKSWIATGTVTDEQGQPIEGVNLSATSGVLSSHAQTGSTTTDADGKYTLRFSMGACTSADMGRGPYYSIVTIAASKAGYASRSRVLSMTTARREDDPQVNGPGQTIFINKPYRIDFVMTLSPQVERSTPGDVQG